MSDTAGFDDPVTILEGRSGREYYQSASRPVVAAIDLLHSWCCDDIDCLTCERVEMAKAGLRPFSDERMNARERRTRCMNDGRIN